MPRPIMHAGAAHGSTPTPIPRSDDIKIDDIAQIADVSLQIVRAHGVLAARRRAPLDRYARYTLEIAPSSSAFAVFSIHP